MRTGGSLEYSGTRLVVLVSRFDSVRSRRREEADFHENPKVSAASPRRLRFLKPLPVKFVVSFARSGAYNPPTINYETRSNSVGLYCFAHHWRLDWLPQGQEQSFTHNVSGIRGRAQPLRGRHRIPKLHGRYFGRFINRGLCDASGENKEIYARRSDARHYDTCVGTATCEF